MENNDKNNAILHKDNSLNRLDLSFMKHIESNEYKTSNLLAYWINDFAVYHDSEKNFDPSKLKIFKRGDIIKVNLGFNIGNELGGLHYCIVLNKKDNPRSGTLNIIPLSSIKESKSYNDYTCVNLGNELYMTLFHKFQTEYAKLMKKIDDLQKKLPQDITEELQLVTEKQIYLTKIKDEVLKMKCGSIALVHQMTTISKQRIFKTPILSGIKLSNNSLDLIDAKLIQLFTK